MMNCGRSIVVINAVGDIALFRTMQERFHSHGTSPFARVVSILNDCDLSDVHTWPCYSWQGPDSPPAKQATPFG